MPLLFRGWKLILALTALATFVIYLGTHIASFIHIFGAHAGVIFTQAEIADAYSAHPPDPSLEVIPRIIHQVYHDWSDPTNETLPLDWLETRQTCIDQNPDWQHWLWTATKSREFLATHYPAFLSTYDAFRYPVQRIDALRYFLLRHYGGIYMDLDNGCLTALDPLRVFPTFVVDGAQGALSNDILGAEPNHPFWILLTDSIPRFAAWPYVLPYITISYATGQWFETAIWEEYHRNLPKGREVLTRVNTDGREGAPEQIFFMHTRGGTWVNWDNRVFSWVGEHLFSFAVILVVGIGGLGLAGWVMLKWVSGFRGRTRGRFGYTKVAADGSEQYYHINRL